MRIITKPREKNKSEWSSRRPIGLNGPHVSGCLSGLHGTALLRKRSSDSGAEEEKLRMGSSSAAVAAVVGGVRGGERAAFLWWDRKNNPQENCWGWIKRPGE